MSGAGRIVLTVGVEDWFHAGVWDGLIPHGRWKRFEKRVAHSTKTTLDLLDAAGARATFFVMGWVAENLPEVVREIARRGHEVATQGYLHRTIAQMTPEEFRDDLLRSRDALEHATGRRVLGHRVPHFLGPDDLWALDVLAKEGWRYDSSVRVAGRRFSAEPWRGRQHVHAADGHEVVELPVSSTPLLGLHLPIAGGNWFRQLPTPVVRHALERWARTEPGPFVMYFQVWELDPEQPRIEAASRLSRLRHYRNLDRMPDLLARTLSGHEVTGAAAWLGLEQGPAEERPPRDAPIAVFADPDAGGAGLLPVTVVIPCFNESATLRYLSGSLEALSAELSRRYRVTYAFVDDASTDDTVAGLESLFGRRTDCRILRHERNRGVAAAIMTGLRAAETEVVCSMDCDCTYDPLELANMIPLLTDGVDLVTASPYHPEGHVKNVPGWRLFLSRGASALYRRTLRRDLHTWTSCFRVYRRTAVQDIDVAEGGFLGVAELLCKALLRGQEVVEHPATLDVRVFGQSKMKTAKAVLGHLRLLRRLHDEGRKLGRLGAPR